MFFLDFLEFPREVAFLDDGELWNSLSMKEHKLKSKKELSSWELLEYWWNITSCYLIHSSGIEKASLGDDLDQWCPTIFSRESTFFNRKKFIDLQIKVLTFEKCIGKNKRLIVEAVTFEGIWMLVITTCSICYPKADLLLSLCVSVTLCACLPYWTGGSTRQSWFALVTIYYILHTQPRSWHKVSIFSIFVEWMNKYIKLSEYTYMSHPI